MADTTLSAFTGFPQEGLTFLSELGTKDGPAAKDWFTANRATYDSHVVAPAKAFVTAMGDALGEHISPAIEAQPKTNGSIAPINNDLRFSPNAAPYKDHLMFRFWEGHNKKTAPMLMVRLSPTDGVGFATGIMLSDISQWRAAIDKDATGKPFAVALDKLVKATKADVVGADLKNVPKPFNADHPRADLLRHKSFQARWVKPTPKAVSSASFVNWCAKELSRTADLHRWFVANMS